jgi:hypothetical protein
MPPTDREIRDLLIGRAGRAAAWDLDHLLESATAGPRGRSWRVVWRTATLVGASAFSVGVIVLAALVLSLDARHGPSSATSLPLAATPEPSESVEASPSSAAFADITLSGTGKTVAKFTIPTDAAAIAVISHEGEGPFTVGAVVTFGAVVCPCKDTLGLVDTIGSYSGTVELNADVDTRLTFHPVAFAIDADGPWTITIKPMSAAPAWDPATPLEGTGDHVYRVVPTPPSPYGTFNLVYRGDGTFIVYGYNLDGQYGLADATGNYSDKVAIYDQTFLLAIRASSGSWSIRPG